MSRNRRLALRMLVPLLTITALRAPSAAHAERWSGVDPTGDVTSFTWDPEPEPCGTITETVLPEDAGHDITRVRIIHARDALRMTADVRDLKASFEGSIGFHLDLPERDYFVEVDRYQASGQPHPEKEVFFAAEPEWPTEEELDEMEADGQCAFGAAIGGRACRGLVGRFSPRLDLVSVDLPRSCVKNPRWARVGVELSGGDDLAFDRWAPPGSDQTGFVGPLGPRVRPSDRALPQKGSPSKVSRVTNSSTGWRRSFVISRAGFPIGTTAASAN